NEHRPRTNWVEIVGIGCRNGENVGSARGTDNVNRSGGWIGQVHCGKKAGSAWSDVSQTSSGLKCHLRVCSRSQGNVADGTVRQSPSGGRRAREAREFCGDIRVGIQV